ncbi:MAG TPA: hypothetical protein VKA61_02210, partial [Sphingomicrobium sp.]|nr:hypothetical protein [Sphingomicrobium sp.]
SSRRSPRTTLRAAGGRIRSSDGVLELQLARRSPRKGAAVGVVGSALTAVAIGCPLLRLGLGWPDPGS